MYIVGIIFLLFGGVAIAWSADQKDTIEYQWDKAFDGTDYAYIDAVYILAIIVLIIGMSLIFLRAVKDITASRTKYQLPYTADNLSVYARTADTEICSACLGELSAEDIFCPRCGQKKQEKPVSKKLFCSFCGSKLEENDGSSYCPYCGNKI